MVMAEVVEIWGNDGRQCHRRRHQIYGMTTVVVETYYDYGNEKIIIDVGLCQMKMISEEAVAEMRNIGSGSRYVV